jgi:general secretion pathway protein E
LTQDNGEELERIDSLGMSLAHFDIFSRAISFPNGIIILSGPTGSGKTTTLYAALRHLKKSGDRHLVSIEDPVEKPVDGVTQIKVDSEGERVTFNKALRSVLRHDPDIVMVGEIRDGETADIAVKAALTGHLVLSTLHTNSAAGVLSRLINLGMPPFMIASTLRLAIAQRLVRRPCPYCMEWIEADNATKMAFGWSRDDLVKVPKTKGCSFCGNTGYSGRCALYEMIEIDSDVRKLILNGAEETEISKAVYGKKNLPSLRLDGAKKVLEGQTTVEEVEAVTIEDFH